MSLQRDDSTSCQPDARELDGTSTEQYGHDDGLVVQGKSSESEAAAAPGTTTPEYGSGALEGGGRQRLWGEVAGRVWIPDIWGQEELLKDWVDCSAFDAALVPAEIVSARSALAEEGRRVKYAGGFRIENRCS